MGSRRKARQYALQMLYQWDLIGDSTDKILDLFWVGVSADSSERAFAEQLFLGVVQSVDELDDRIEALSHNWKMRRMAHVDRNILRIGAFELCKSEDVPANVALNEAIELGKTFSASESGAFINGILDRIAASSGREVGEGGPRERGPSSEKSGQEHSDG